MKIGGSKLRELEAILEGAHSVTAEVSVWDYRRQKMLSHSDGTPYSVEVSAIDWTIDGSSLDTFSGSFELPLYELDTITGNIVTMLTGKDSDALLPFGNTLKISIRVSNLLNAVVIDLPWAIIWEVEEQFKSGVLRVQFRGLEALVSQSELGRDAPNKEEWGTIGNTVKPWVLSLVERALPAWADNENRLTISDELKLLGTKDFIADEDASGKIPKETVWNAGTNLWEAASGLAASRSQARLAWARSGKLTVYPALTEEYGVGGAVGGSDDEVVRLRIATKDPDSEGRTNSGTLIDMTRRITREGFANRVRVIVKDTNVVKPIPEIDSGGAGISGPAFWDGRVYSPVKYVYRVGDRRWPSGGASAGPVPLSTGEYYAKGGYHGAWDLSGLAYGQPFVVAPVGRGTPVYAVLSGTVQATRSSVRDNPKGVNPGSGSPANYVVLWARDVCGQKVTVVYYHLMQSSVVVRPGSFVFAGDMLAKVGNSGNSTGYHLHIHVAKGWKSLGSTWGKGTMSYPPGKHWGQPYPTSPPNPLSKSGMCRVGSLAGTPFFGFMNQDTTDSSNSYTAELTSGPLRWGGPIGYAAKVFDVSSADPKKGEAEKLAKARLKKLSALSSQVDLRTLCYPHLDPGDVVAVEIPDPTDVTKYKLAKYTIVSVSCSLPGGVLEITTKEYGRG